MCPSLPPCNARPPKLPWQTFFADPFVQEHVRLDAVVCLCDSPRLLRMLVAPPPTAVSAGDGDAGAKRSVLAVEGGEQAGNDSSDAAATLVMSQLALSDRVLLNKSDLITPAEVRFFSPRVQAAAAATLLV